MATIGRLDFEAGNPGNEFETIYRDIEEVWRSHGKATDTSELDNALRDKGMAPKRIQAGLNWLKEHGWIEAKTLAGREFVAPVDRVKEPRTSPWLTVNDAADYMRVSKRTLHTWISDGTLKGYRTKAGGALRFRIEDLDKCFNPVGPLTAVSDPVLAELWDNEYDAVYDDL